MAEPEQPNPKTGNGKRKFWITALLTIILLEGVWIVWNLLNPTPPPPSAPHGRQIASVDPQSVLEPTRAALAMVESDPALLRAALENLPAALDRELFSVQKKARLPKVAAAEYVRFKRTFPTVPTQEGWDLLTGLKRFFPTILAQATHHAQMERTLFSLMRLYRRIDGELKGLRSQTPGLMPLIQQARDGLAAGRYRQLIAVLTQARQLEEKEGQNWRSPDAATLAALAGWTEMLRLAYHRATPHFQEAVELTELASHKIAMEKRAKYFYQLGYLLWKSGRYEDADFPLKRSLSLWRTVLPTDDPNHGRTLDQMALNEAYQKRYEKAEGLFLQALAVRQKTMGADHAHVADTHANLAAMYKDQGRLDQAVHHFEKALAVRKKSAGEVHPAVAMILTGLGATHHRHGQPQRALNRYRQAMAIWKRLPEPLYPWMAVTLNNLGNLYQTGGHIEIAEAFYRQTLDTYGETLEADAPESLPTLDGLAMVLERQNRGAEAKPVLERALTILKKIHPDHPDRQRLQTRLTRLVRDSSAPATEIP